jgi:hypothetical protein
MSIGPAPVVPLTPSAASSCNSPSNAISKPEVEALPVLVV